jgi:hypothetical protein
LVRVIAFRRNINLAQRNWGREQDGKRQERAIPESNSHFFSFSEWLSVLHYKSAFAGLQNRHHASKESLAGCPARLSKRIDGALRS